jgi:hypothetical protein
VDEKKAKKINMTKFGVKEEILFFSDGKEILFYSIMELDWFCEDNFDQVDQISEGVYYKGNLLGYHDLLDLVEEENDAEHIDSSVEKITIFEKLEDAKIKFDNLLNITPK